MKKSELSDKQLIEWLSNMPEVKDHRDPRDIYQNISLRLAKRKKRIVWIMPTIAAATAIILIFILASNQVINSDSKQIALKSENNVNKNERLDKATPVKEDLNQDNKKETQAEKVETAQDENKSDHVKGENRFAAGNIEMDELDGTTAVYREDLEDHDVLTYGIPDESAQVVVPVSVLVPKSGKSFLEKWKDTMSELKEKEWGLSDYYPINGNISLDEDDNQLNVDVPADQQYGMGSVAPILFKDVLLQLLNDMNLKKMNLSTEGTPGIHLGNLGDMTEITAEAKRNHAYYLFSPNNRTEPFMVPSAEEFDSIEQALVSMKQDANPDLKASIPEDIDVNSINTSGDSLIIKLRDSKELENNKRTLQMIEAILLTAKDFNYDKVKFENPPTEQIGKFQISKDLNVPVAANKEFINQ